MVVVLIGNVLPLILLSFRGIEESFGSITLVIASILVLIGIYATEKIWIEAPQRIPLA
jgi:hypothetical protein